MYSNKIDMAKRRRRDVIEKTLFITEFVLNRLLETLWVPFEKSSVYGDWAKHKNFTKNKRDIYRAKKSGYLEEKIVDDEVFLRLTPKGEARLESGFPVVRRLNFQWDKKWRLVLFDIPEQDRVVRDRLRRQLVEMGFGMIQISAWITPYPVGQELKQILNEEGSKEETIVIEGTKLFGEDGKKLARRIWHLEKLEDRYRDWLDKAEEGKTNLKFLIDFYLDILREDPYLPRELLPDNWPGEKAIKIIKKLI